MSSSTDTASSLPHFKEAPAPFRIGIDGRELLADQVTGIGRYLRNFLNNAVPANPDVSFIVYGNQHTCLNMEAPNLKLETIPERLVFWWDQAVLGRCTFRDTLDVFLSPYDKAPAITSCPLVMTVHDLIFFEISYKGWLGKHLYNAAYRLIRGPVIRRADRVITDSQYSRRDLVEKLGVDNDRIRPILIGISPAYHPITDPDQIAKLRSHYQLMNPYILYVGNFNPHKNVRALVSGFAGLPDAIRSKHTLALCGRKSSFRDQIEKACSSLGIDKQVKFIDFVEESDMPVLYSEATVFAFPSLYEGFGLPPLEAMACGTPVVSSGATSLSEVVADAGIVIDATHPEEIEAALTRVLTDEILRNDLIAAGIARAKEYSQETAASLVMDVLREAAESRTSNV